MRSFRIYIYLILLIGDFTCHVMIIFKVYYKKITEMSVTGQNRLVVLINKKRKHLSWCHFFRKKIRNTIEKSFPSFKKSSNAGIFRTFFFLTKHEIELFILIFCLCRFLKVEKCKTQHLLDIVKICKFVEEENMFLKVLFNVFPLKCLEK